MLREHRRNIPDSRLRTDRVRLPQVSRRRGQPTGPAQAHPGWDRRAPDWSPSWSSASSPIISRSIDSKIS